MSQRSLALLALAVTTPTAVLAQSISLQAATFDPAAGAPKLAADLTRTSLPKGATGRWLVQFNGPITAGDRSSVSRAGMTVDGYVPTNALVLSGTEAQVAKLRSLASPRYVGAFHPAYRLSPTLGQYWPVDGERKLEVALGLHRAVVHFWSKSEVEALVRTNALAGVQTLHWSTIGDRPVANVVGSLESLQTLAKNEAVQWVEDDYEQVLRNETTQWVAQSNVNGSRPIWDKGIKGQGMIVGVIDGRMDMNHNCFRDPSNNTVRADHRKVIAYYSNSGLGADSHGTHVAGTVAGDREPVNGLTLNNGNAPQAKIVFTNLSDVGGGRLYTSLVRAFDAGARDHTNSWGNDGTTSYTSDCVAIDTFSWEREDAMVAFAVTNTGTLKTPENAKSCLAVGATQQSPNQANHGSGGTGPTNDGRRKPEVYTPGVGIVSASSGTTDGFRSLTGTSMACPSTTAMAALARQWYKEGRYLEQISPNSRHDATGALLRATLMAGSVDMTGVAQYPSNREGFGRILLDNVLWFKGENRRTRFRDFRRVNGLTPGESRQMKFVVGSSDTPLRVAMSFTDFPALVNAASAPVNNMDLELVAPNGDTYKGNVFDTNAGRSILGGNFDAINSTEMAIIPSPQTGVWTARVTCRTVNQGDKQGFALVANADILPINIVP